MIYAGMLFAHSSKPGLYVVRTGGPTRGNVHRVTIRSGGRPQVGPPIGGVFVTNHGAVDLDELSALVEEVIDADG